MAKTSITDKLSKGQKFRVGIGIALMVLSLYALASIISFFINWEVDHSFAGVATLAGDGTQTANLCGKLGNFLSAFLVTRWFGVSAALLPIIGILCALRLLKWGRIKTWRLCVILFFSTLLISLSFGVFSSNNTALGAGFGGAHGYAVGHVWLISVVGKFGSITLLTVGYFLLLSYIVPTFSLRARIFMQQLFNEKKKEEEEVKAVKAIENPKIEEEETPVDDDVEITFEPEESGVTFTVEESEEEEEMEVKTEEVEQAEEEKDLELLVENGDAVEVLGEVEKSLLPYDPKADLSRYQYPTPDLLNEYSKSAKSVSPEELEANKNKIVRTLGHYNISISEIKATIGPTVTLYEIVPAPGVRISKIKGLENDIALSLAALGIRIIAPIPGKGTIGIEVPNQHPEIVPMQAIIKSAEFNDSKFDLPIGLGKTITNKSFVIDLAKMPHLLIAGATGQGKSVGLNAVLTSLLYKMHPSQLKLVLVDPKKVELPLYGKIEKHFLAKLPDSDEAIITDNQKVIYTLNSLCIEMDSRYDLLKDAAVRNIKEYNQKFVDRRLNPEKGHRYLPYIVLVIDEFADLIMTAGREVETPIARLAQLARAIGIHLVIATQRPTTNVITGLIKANFPARVAFRVTSMIDSRTILDTPGAQHLIGKGDMLVSTGSDITRVQCAFVDTPEVEKIVEFIGKQQGYPMAFPLPEYVPENGDGGGVPDVDLTRRDGMFEQAARLLVETQQGSTSLIQRKFNLGYNRAGRIMDQLEAAGIVGAQEGSKPRQVRIPDVIALEQLLKQF
ncbi:MAG: DNA translocase FtsK [Prevotellaceae bacterium]|jgi:S-DNA-T family DNA segregation ATPase FtsK/SpoIIIE|nr:DNA translocase FtsK [Prevotellaceae bacterium]